MNREQFIKLYPNASQSTILRNCPSGIRADNPKPVEGKPLVRELPREEASRQRFAIRFTVYAVRPSDWDNYDIKAVQDLLVSAGVLPDDKWDSLEGSVRSCKVHSREEERTEIVIQ